MKYLILGNKGQLAKEFERLFAEKNIQYIGYDLPELDISDRTFLKEMFVSVKPDIVINCAAYNNVDLAESKPEDAFKTNSEGVKNIAELCEKSKAFFVHFSSDYVFDGAKNSTYIEQDLTNPINKYGESKLAGERGICDITDRYLIFRLSWVYGNGKQNFIYKLNEWVKTNKTIKVVNDEISVPTSTKLISEVVLDSLKQGIYGLYHLVNSGFCSRYDWANEIIKLTESNAKIEPAKLIDFNLPAQRPHYSAMSNNQIADILNIEIPNWEYSLKQFLTLK